MDDRLPDPACPASTTTSATRARGRPTAGPSSPPTTASRRNTKLEVNASQNDKDYIAAVNWKQAEQCVAQGKAKTVPAQLRAQLVDGRVDGIARTEMRTSVQDARPGRLPGLVYYLPTPKSPHGVDVDPTGEYIVAGGKLATRHPGALVHQDAEGDRRQGVRGRGSTASRCSSTRRRSPAKCRSPASARCTPSSTARATPTRRCSSQLRDREVEAQGLEKCSTACRPTTRSAT